MLDLITWISAAVFTALSVGRLWLCNRLWKSRHRLPVERRPRATAVLVAQFASAILGFVLAAVLVTSSVAPEALNRIGPVAIPVLVLGAILTVPGILVRVRYRSDSDLTRWFSGTSSPD